MGMGCQARDATDIGGGRATHQAVLQLRLLLLLQQQLLARLVQLLLQRNELPAKLVGDVFIAVFETSDLRFELVLTLERLLAAVQLLLQRVDDAGRLDHQQLALLQLNLHFL